MSEFALCRLGIDITLPRFRVRRPKPKGMWWYVAAYCILANLVDIVFTVLALLAEPTAHDLLRFSGDIVAVYVWWPPFTSDGHRPINVNAWLALTFLLIARWIAT